MSFALPTGAEARWTGTPGPRAVICVNGGTAAELPGTWSASVEWLVRRAGRPFPGLRFLEVRYRIKSWRRLPLCIEDARAAIEAARAAGAEEIALLGFSMGGAVAVQIADDPGGRARRRRQSLAPAAARPRAARRAALRVLHGSLERGLPGIPGVKPRSRKAPGERAKARGVDARGSVIRAGDPPDRAAAHAADNACPCRAPAGGRARRRRAGATLRVGLYRAVRGAVYVLARLLYRIEIAGRVPPGACVVAANHESLLDPPLLALVTRRPLHFLAKVELWRYRPGAWLMDALGGIPIRRDRRDLLSVGRAEELLRAGECVAIFPQGTVTGGAWTRGAARLALTTGVPIVPVRIVGTARALSHRRIRFPKIRIVVGEPIQVAAARPTVALARALTRELQERVERLT